MIDIRVYLYKLLEQYSEEQIAHELNYCVNHPKPTLLEVVDITRDFNRFHENLYLVSRFNQQTREKSVTLIPHSLLPSVLDKLYDSGFRTFEGGRGDPNSPSNVMQLHAHRQELPA